MDILIYESGNGGDISFKNEDIELTEGLMNQPYLAMFGGNTEASTSGQELQGEERKDWWGNSFLDDDAKMNSNLERTLNEVSLTSAGRGRIVETAKKDIEFIQPIAEVECNASITGIDKATISVKINQITVGFQWNKTKSELIEEIVI